MKVLRKSFLLTVVCIAFLAACNTSAPAPVPSPVLSGGWSRATPNDSRIQGAAEYAVKTQALATQSILKLSSIQSAQQQVVAGMNYRLNLSVLKNGKEQSAEAVVWKKLDGTYQLTDWSWK